MANNPFLNWTPEQVAAHNARVSRKGKLVGQMNPLPPLETAKSIMDEVKVTRRPMTDEERLNKLEKRYLAHLRRERVLCLGIQNITIKMADDTRLTPDFNYLDGSSGRVVFVDTKGPHQWEDSLIKMKVAARQILWGIFQIVTEKDGGWNIRELKP